MDERGVLSLVPADSSSQRSLEAALDASVDSAVTGDDIEGSDEPSESVDEPGCVPTADAGEAIVACAGGAAAAAAAAAAGWAGETAVGVGGGAPNALPPPRTGILPVFLRAPTVMDAERWTLGVWVMTVGLGGAMTAGPMGMPFALHGRRMEWEGARVFGGPAAAVPTPPTATGEAAGEAVATDMVDVVVVAGVMGCASR